MICNEMIIFRPERRPFGDKSLLGHYSDSKWVEKVRMGM